MARQYTGSARKIADCQIGVFVSHVSRRGHAFVDRALYLPKAWTDDPIHLRATHVSSDDDRARHRDWCAFSWVAADTVSCVADIERDLRQAAKGYVLGVDAAHIFRSWGKPRCIAGTAADIAEALGSVLARPACCGGSLSETDFECHEA